MLTRDDFNQESNSHFELSYNTKKTRNDCGEEVKGYLDKRL